MKKFLSTLLCLGLATVALADVKIVQKLKTSPMMGQPGKDSTVSISVKGKKARIDSGEGQSYQIVDLTQGKVFIVDDSKKQVMVMTTEMMKQAANMMGQLGGNQGKPKIEKLGTSHTYNGYKCDDVKMTMEGVMTLDSVSCVSKELDVKEFEPFKEFGSDFTKMFGMDASSEIPGYAVHSDTKMTIMGQKMDSTTDLVSISHDAINDSIFVIPADYKVQDMKMPKK